MRIVKQRFLYLVLVIVMFCGVLAGCGASSTWKYKCKYCGTKMEAYWAYDNGYICSSCYKKYYK